VTSRVRLKRHPAVTIRAPTTEPMMPLGRSSRPSPDRRLASRPPTSEPTRPATIAIVQSTPVDPLPRMSCAAAPTSIPKRMMPMKSMFRA